MGSWLVSVTGGDRTGSRAKADGGILSYGAGSVGDLVFASRRLRLTDRSRSVALEMRLAMLFSVTLRPRLWRPLADGGAGAVRTGTVVSAGGTATAASSSFITISMVAEPRPSVCGMCGRGAGGGGGGVARCCSSFRIGGAGGAAWSSWDPLRTPITSSMPRASPRLDCLTDFPRLTPLRSASLGSSGIGADMLRGMFTRTGGW